MERKLYTEEGHLNSYVRDHDSIVTGYGQHDRVIVCQPKYDPYFDQEVVYVRIDHLWDLEWPTEQQIRKVMRSQGIKGRWKQLGDVRRGMRNCSETWFVRY